MTIGKQQDGSKLTVSLQGRLDTATSPQLEGELHTALNGVGDLVFDLAELEYISSGGLRVLFSPGKR